MASEANPEKAPPIHQNVTDQDPYLVTWDGDDDRDDPFNWPMWKKVAFTCIGCIMVFLVSFASSIFGPAASITAETYGVSEEVMNLSVALFVAGFAVGPLLFAPLSQIVGHRVPILVSLIGGAILQIPQSVAQNAHTIIISRFLMGVVGSGVLSVGSGMLAEVWSIGSRAIAIGLSATAMNTGSIVGPIAGSFILDRYGWRWIGWVTLLVYGAVGLLTPFTLRESSRKRILERRAKALRRQTGDDNYYAITAKSGVTFSALVQRYGKTPVQMMAQEPILIIITAYLTLVYGTLYLSYQMFPYAFRNNRHWSAPIASLPFLSVLLGVVTAWGIVSYYTLVFYRRRKDQKGCATPEDRLPTMILGGCMLPPSLLWFGWSMRTHWMAQVISCYFVGCSLQLIFITGVVYIIDVYVANANSAISIHVAVRSLVSASFPLWGAYVYRGLGIEWSATLLAGLGFVLMPSPIAFYFWGERIRSWSRFCEAPVL